jgi:hypothetical protein
MEERETVLVWSWILRVTDMEPSIEFITEHHSITLLSRHFLI